LNIRAAKKKEVQNIAKASANKIGMNFDIKKIALPFSTAKTINRNLLNQSKMQQAKALDTASPSASTDPQAPALRLPSTDPLPIPPLQSKALEKSRRLWRFRTSPRSKLRVRKT